MGELPAAADRVLAATGRVALAVALAGAAVRGGTGWTDIAAALDRGGDTFRGHPYANTFKALQAATEALPPDLAQAPTTAWRCTRRTPPSRSPRSPGTGHSSAAAPPPTPCRICGCCTTGGC